LIEDVQVKEAGAVSPSRTPEPQPNNSQMGGHCPFMSLGGCSVIAVGAVSGGEESDGSSFDWNKLHAFIAELKRYYRLFWLLFGLLFLVAAVVYLWVPRSYTAVAVLGPPAPSPTSTMISTISGGGIASGLAAKMMGGGTAGGSDPFQDFQQLLPSTGLAQVLIERDQILQVIFDKKWDAKNRRWKEIGALGGFKNTLKRQMSLPVNDVPDVDDLTSYFDQHLAVSKTSGSGGGVLGGLSPYIKVSFRYEDPREAERLLTIILAEADRVVREHQRRNVTSRVAFLRKELERSDLSAGERTSIISILSDQEQLLSMVEADQRYASTLIVPPYAASKPSYPPSPATLVVLTAVLSIIGWVLTVAVSIRSRKLQKLICWSRTPNHAAA